MHQTHHCIRQARSHYFLPFILVLLAIFSGGLQSCALLSSNKDHVTLTVNERNLINKTYQGRSMVLAQSVYLSNFFGQSDKKLAEARPLEIIEWFNRQGKSITLPHQNTKVLLPAGTLVILRQILEPQDMSKDPHLPAAHAWVMFDTEDAHAKGKTLVLVLDGKANNFKQFKKQMQLHFEDPMWVRHWLQIRSGEVLQGIFSKKVVNGMSYDEMLAANGTPRGRISPDMIADYGDLQVTLQGNVVTDVASRRAVAHQALAIAKAKAAAASRYSKKKKKGQHRPTSRRKKKRKISHQRRRQPIVEQTAEVTQPLFPTHRR